MLVPLFHQIFTQLCEWEVLAARLFRVEIIIVIDVFFFGQLAIILV